ncbi:hypothetical protein E2C01_086030 [Portunus trituberculatus]|uniref:Uncharacterized protein n=1 Tax=Portunus trituberculatus TaxID=210409 RepID=A0A5B7J2P4_PORTR|nr:hypothetical protein [Portunus trituberculatus]
MRPHTRDSPRQCSLSEAVAFFGSVFFLSHFHSTRVAPPAEEMDLLLHGEDAGVSPRARSPSKHRIPATATRGSARSPHPLGRTCPQSHYPRHVSPAVVRPTQSPHHHSPSPSSNSSPKKLPKPFPFNKLLPDVLHTLGRTTPRSPRRNSPAPTIKVPQLPRLRENVRKLPVDFRLLLKDSLHLLQQRKASIQFTGAPEKDGPKTVLDQEAQGTSELKDEVLDRSSIR